MSIFWKQILLTFKYPSYAFLACLETKNIIQSQGFIQEGDNKIYCVSQLKLIDLPHNSEGLVSSIQ